MEGLAVPFTAIADGLKNIKDFIKDPLDYMKSALMQQLSYMNPFSENFILRSAFVPPNNFFSDKFDMLDDIISSKLPIIQNIKDITSSIINAFQNGISGNVPEFKITLPGKYGGSSAKVIDFSFYGQYRHVINAFIIMTSYFYFIKRLVKRIPQIIYMG